MSCRALRKGLKIKILSIKADKKGPEKPGPFTKEKSLRRGRLRCHGLTGLAHCLADLIIDRFNAVGGGLDAHFGNPRGAAHKVVKALLRRFILKLCKLVQGLAAQRLFGILRLLFNRFLSQGHAGLHNGFAVFLIQRACLGYSFAGLTAHRARILRELVKGVLLGCHKTLHRVRG